MKHLVGKVKNSSICKSSLMKNYAGYDLILLKLYPEDIKTKGVFVPVKPLCMPKDENGGINQKKFIMN